MKNEIDYSALAMHYEASAAEEYTKEKPTLRNADSYLKALQDVRSKLEEIKSLYPDGVKEGSAPYKNMLQIAGIANAQSGYDLTYEADDGSMGYELDYETVSKALAAMEKKVEEDVTSKTLANQLSKVDLTKVQSCTGDL